MNDLFFFMFFLENRACHFMQTRKQFALNVKHFFLGKKKKKNSLKCRLLIF